MERTTIIYILLILAILALLSIVYMARKSKSMTEKKESSEFEKLFDNMFKMKYSATGATGSNDLEKDYWNKLGILVCKNENWKNGSPFIQYKVLEKAGIEINTDTPLIKRLDDDPDLLASLILNSKLSEKDKKASLATMAFLGSYNEYKYNKDTDEVEIIVVEDDIMPKGFEAKMKLSKFRDALYNFADSMMDSKKCIEMMEDKQNKENKKFNINEKVSEEKKERCQKSSYMKNKLSKVNMCEFIVPTPSLISQ